MAVTTPRVVIYAWKKFYTDNCSQIAAGLSYYVLFASVPLCVLTFSLLSTLGVEGLQERVVSRIATYVGVDETEVTITIDDAARGELEAMLGPSGVVDIDGELESINDPDEGVERRRELVRAIDDGDAVTISGFRLEADQLDSRIEGTFADAVRSYADSRRPIPVISVVLVALSASIIFSAYSRALNHIWKVETLRPMVQQKLVDLAALAVVGLLLLASATASGVIGALRSSVSDATREWVFQGDIAWGTLLFGVPLLASFLLFACAYMFLPRRKNPFRDIWLGAAVGALGFEGLKSGYSFYIASISNYDDAYAAFGAVLLWLFLVYASAYLFLLGAEIAYAYPVVREGAGDVQPLPSGDADAVVAKRGPLRTLWAAFAGLFVSRKDD